MTNERPRSQRSQRLVERNIAALVERRRRARGRLGWQERLAERISRFSGTMPFVWLHVAIYGGWIAINLDLIPFIRPFDPTFVTLAMTASVEAIFLSTFILITQNQMQAYAEERADLNLQISLLAEHEVTRLVEMVSEIAKRMDIPAAHEPELDALKKDVHPEEVLDTISRQEKSLDER